jgi:hypothetical protein
MRPTGRKSARRRFESHQLLSQGEMTTMPDNHVYRIIQVAGSSEKSHIRQRAGGQIRRERLDPPSLALFGRSEAPQSEIGKSVIKNKPGESRGDELDFHMLNRRLGTRAGSSKTTAGSSS